MLGFIAARETIRRILVPNQHLVVELQQAERWRRRRIKVKRAGELWGGGPISMTKVLPVESEAGLRESTAIVLRGGSCPVTAVSTAEAGILELQARPFAVLVTDFNLLGRDGLWLIQEGERQQLLGGTKVVFVTSNRSLSFMSDLIVLFFPVSPDDLLQVVRRAGARPATAGVDEQAPV